MTPIIENTGHTLATHGWDAIIATIRCHDRQSLLTSPGKWPNVVGLQFPFSTGNGRQVQTALR